MHYQQNVCIYCGEAKHLTKDHIPPKNLFAKPYPKNLWTVPACRSCNNQCAKDDEYFRVALTLTEKAKGSPGREAVLPSVMQRINRPQSDRFRAALLAESEILPRFTNKGVYINLHRQIRFDLHRMDRVAERIVKGLFYRVKGHRLPDDHGVNVLFAEAIWQLGTFDLGLEETAYQFIDLISHEPLTEIGNVFGFRWIQSANGTDHTMWLFYFYGKLEYYCTTFRLRV